MRRLWRRRRKSAPSADACAAVDQACRALVDAQRLADHVDEVATRAHRVARRADEVIARNHIAEAVTRAIRGA